jgi:bifunctional UDP-N-acetylglucosamine pyrophosphorylase / glucosamine-1-phosphate N-acetyltransferase
VADVHTVVLAAGAGRRMRSARPKLLHRLAGRPIVEHLLAIAATLRPATKTIVLGHMPEEFESLLAGWPDVRRVRQAPLLGTAHAMLATEPLLARSGGTIVVLPGDAPHLRPATLRRLVEHHEASGAAATLATASSERPFGYARILRRRGRLMRVLDERAASPVQRRIREISSGFYAFRPDALFEALRSIEWEAETGERSLPDLVDILKRRRLDVETIEVADAREVRGINCQTELAEAGALMRQTKNEELMAAGVTIVDPATTYVDPDVEVGPDTVLHPNVYLEGTTRVGAACEIHAGARIVNSTLADRVVILNYCVIADAEIGEHATLGPFAHLRPGSVVGSEAKVGNFVELKKTTLGRGSKASHLSYLGDAIIGEDVNIGAGTITCNYDGTSKHQTVIEDGVFVGSDSQLIAPVRVGRGAYVAAGSSITEDVPAEALAIARGRQVNKDGWVRKRKPAE